jgi:hypothetical protein
MTFDRRIRSPMRANDNGPRTEEQAAAQAALDALRSRGASGEKVAQSTLAEAVRRAAEADLYAQHTKRWEPTR